MKTIHCRKQFDMSALSTSPGFTLVEIMVTMAVLVIMAVIAIPRVTTALPNMRLKAAARGMFSDMQSARLGAIKENRDWAIVFDPTADSYHICSDPGADDDWTTTGDNTVLKTVRLADFQNGIRFGHGSIADGNSVTGGTFPADDVSYVSPDNVAVFNSRGTGTSGYAYMENQATDTVFAVGSRASGVIKLLKWNGTQWN